MADIFSAKKTISNTAALLKNMNSTIASTPGLGPVSEWIGQLLMGRPLHPLEENKAPLIGTLSLGALGGLLYMAKKKYETRPTDPHYDDLIESVFSATPEELAQIKHSNLADAVFNHPVLDRISDLSSPKTNPAISTAAESPTFSPQPRKEVLNGETVIEDHNLDPTPNSKKKRGRPKKVQNDPSDSSMALQDARDLDFSAFSIPEMEQEILLIYRDMLQQYSQYIPVPLETIRAGETIIHRIGDIQATPTHLAAITIKFLGEVVHPYEPFDSNFLTRMMDLSAEAFYLLYQNYEYWLIQIWLEIQDLTPLTLAQPKPILKPIIDLTYDPLQLQWLQEHFGCFWYVESKILEEFQALNIKFNFLPKEYVHRGELIIKCVGNTLRTSPARIAFLIFLFLLQEFLPDSQIMVTDLIASSSFAKSTIQTAYKNLKEKFFKANFILEYVHDHPNIPNELDTSSFMRFRPIHISKSPFANLYTIKDAEYAFTQLTISTNLKKYPRLCRIGTELIQRLGVQPADHHGIRATTMANIILYHIAKTHLVHELGTGKILPHILSFEYNFHIQKIVQEEYQLIFDLIIEKEAELELPTTLHVTTPYSKADTLKQLDLFFHLFSLSDAPKIQAECISIANQLEESQNIESHHMAGFILNFVVRTYFHHEIGAARSRLITLKTISPYIRVNYEQYRVTYNAYFPKINRIFIARAPNHPQIMPQSLKPNQFSNIPTISSDSSDILHGKSAEARGAILETATHTMIDQSRLKITDASSMVDILLQDLILQDICCEFEEMIGTFNMFTTKEIKRGLGIIQRAFIDHPEDPQILAALIIYHLGQQVGVNISFGDLAASFNLPLSALQIIYYQTSRKIEHSDSQFKPITTPVKTSLFD